jgi:protein ImuB
LGEGKGGGLNQRLGSLVLFGGIHSPEPLPSPDTLVQVSRAFTPRIEAAAPTPVLLDLQGLSRAWPSPEALGRALLEAARERARSVNVALATTRTAAMVLARSREGLTVVPIGAEAQALAPLPLSLLDIAPEEAELLARFGLRTIGELAALPAHGLAARLGESGPRLVRLARGEDPRPLVPAPPAERFEITLDLEWPVEGLEPFAFLLQRVLDPLAEALRGRGRLAAALDLELLLVDGRVHERTLRPAAPSALPRTWRTLLLLDLEAHPPGEAIQRVRVCAEPTPARETQFSLLDPAQPSPEKLAETLARLHEFTAGGRGGAAALLDSHRPGAFAVRNFAPGPARSSPLEAAPFPRLALRAFRPPLPAEVRLEGGAPAFVVASGVRGAVLDRAGPWRASGDWWDEAYSREEWDVTLGAGLYRIFRDRLRGGWFVEGELD